VGKLEFNTNNDIDRDFLFIFFRSQIFRKILRKTLIGSDQPYIKTPELLKQRFSFPARIEEQHNIASILSKVDELIQKTDQVIEQTQRLKKGLMQKLLTRGIGHSKYQDVLYNKFSSIVLDEIPVTWKVLTINDLKKSKSIIEFQDGNHGELHPKKSDFDNYGRPFITATQIDEDGNINLSECNRLPESFCRKLRIGFSKGNDVLFTHNATVGRVAIVPNNVQDCIVGTSVTYYRLDENKIDRVFFSYVLKSNFVKKQYQCEMDQTTRQQFSIQKQARRDYREVLLYDRLEAAIRRINPELDEDGVYDALSQISESSFPYTLRPLGNK
jgi:type I restriction enzyme S subunit